MLIGSGKRVGVWAIGVVSTLAILGSGGSALTAKGPNQDESERIPTRTIYVISSQPTPANDSSSDQEAISYGLTRDDFRKMREIPTLEACIPFRFLRAKTGEGKPTRNVCGTTEGWAAEHGLELERGRFLTATDLETRSGIAVISSELADAEFKFEDPIGKVVMLNDIRLKIVGVLKPPSTDRSRGDAAEDQEAKTESDGEESLHRPLQAVDVYVPITTMMANWGSLQMDREDGRVRVFSYELSGVLLRVSSIDQRAPTLEVIKNMMERRDSDSADVIVDAIR